MTELQGTSSPEYQALVDVLGKHLDNGDDVGASLALTVDGESVVDVWGGHADEARTRRWERDTITNVWSTTKTVTSLAALICVERGLLDVHAPVAQYWPEFAANGKADIRVKHLMSHTSGVSGWAQPVEVTDIYDWEKSTAMLAAQAPWWEPGTQSGYHALNQGHLVGEVVRRVSGKTLKQFVADEIAGPLGADFQIGAKPEDSSRIANVIPPPPLPIDLATLDLESVMVKTFTGPAPQASEAWTDAWRAADIGAANGHGNARSVARIQSIIANGGEVDGVRLLSPATIDLIFEEQANGVDLVLGTPVRFGIGFGLVSPDLVPGATTVPDGRICYWGGWGGSIIVIDCDRRITMAYMMNRMRDGLVGNPTSFDLIATLLGLV